MKDTLKVNMNRDFAESFRAAGAPNASLRAALFNDMGKIIAFEVNLGNPEKFGRGSISCSFTQPTTLGEENLTSR